MIGLETIIGNKGGLVASVRKYICKTPAGCFLVTPKQTTYVVKENRQRSNRHALSPLFSDVKLVLHVAQFQAQFTQRIATIYHIAECLSLIFPV